MQDEDWDVFTVRDWLNQYYDGPELTDDEIRKGIANYADITGLDEILHAIETGQWPAPAVTIYSGNDKEQ